MLDKYNAKFDEYLIIKQRTEDARKELEGLQRKRDSMLDLLLYLRECRREGAEDFVNEPLPQVQGAPEGGLYPLVLGKAHSKFSVMSIGVLPPEENRNFYDAKHIYPPGFKSKRKCPGYRGSGKEDSKVVYYCQVRDVDGECVFEIRTIGGRLWSGPKDAVWSEFKEDFDKLNYASIEEFFGLSHETVQKLVEEMGDVSVYDGYTLFSARIRRKKRKAESAPK